MKRRLSAIMAADIAGYSRLMGEDEVATVEALKGHQQEVLPLVAGYGGRIIDTAGDGVLAEFPSVIAAVECATEIQLTMARRNADVPKNRRMQFRIGINLGDVIHDETRIYGDGINVAARLEGIAEPGGICVSAQVFEQVDRALDTVFRALGPHRLKNISRPIDVYAVDLAGPGKAKAQAAEDKALEQEVRFCSAPDGVQLAYSVIGAGPPLVKSGNWMTHLEHDLESPLWRSFWQELCGHSTLVRYDARGNGLSDWDAEHISFEAWVSDLEAVVEAAGIERFDLLGVSQGSAVAVAYAARHPERVSQLVLYGGFAQGANGRARTDSQREEAAAMLALTRLGWGKQNPAFRQMFTSLFAPDASKEQADWFNELQRISTSPECAVRHIQVVGDIDVTALLPHVKAPTLVMHARDDARVPFEAGRKLAAGIPGARFVTLQSRNHFVLPNEPAFIRLAEEIRLFLGR
jgi:class 3 adenylate cyclase/pimeloyl-ACP methyl ester carboxylesterase